MIPVIQEPIIEAEPTHEPWQFTAIDESNFIISEADLQVLTTYIVDLKTYGSAGWIWVDYYIEELDSFIETVP